MRTRRRKDVPVITRSRILKVSAIPLVGFFALSGCSSNNQAAPTPVTTTPAPTIAAVTELSSACASVYEIDLLVSDYSAGAVANGDYTESEALADYLRLAKAVNTGSKSVKTGDGAGQASTLTTNSRKSIAVLNGLNKSATLASMSGKKATRLKTQRARMIKACQAAGFPIPSVNAQTQVSATPTGSGATR
jgi:hypothetical protein